MPHDIEAEKVVLGTIMTERNALSEVRDILIPDCFYNPFHKSVYEAILRIDGRGDRPDLIAVTNEMMKSGGGDMYQLSVISSCFTFDVYQHAALLHDKEKRRRFIEIGNGLISRAFSESDDIVDTLSEAEDSLKNLFQTSKDSLSTIDEAIKGVSRQMEMNATGGRPLTGTPTGFPEIDGKSGGLQRSDLVIIAADTSSGKTSLSIALTMEAAKNGEGVAFYSMEMRKEQIAARMISMESGIPANEIMYSRLLPEQFDRIDRGIGKLYGKPVFFDDRSTSNIDTILASIRTMKMRYDISGAVVDYLQILSVNMRGSNTEQQMGEASRRLKNLAKDLDIWIVALSQLNRDSINPVPSLARLRSSGQIAEAADIVMLIYRPEIYGRYYPDPLQNAPTQGTAMIDIAKGRNIGLARFLVRFDARTTHFMPYDCNYQEFKPIDENPF